MAVLRKHVKPNDYKSYKVTIDGLDLSNLVTGFDVYQDIFSPTWSANILIVDSNNVQITKDVNIGVPVVIEIETDAQKPCDGVMKKTYNFILHSISDKSLIKKDTYGYIMKLVSEPQINDFKKRVSKSYVSKKAEQIVSDVVTEKLGGTLEEMDSSEGVYDVIIPNLSPISAISFVTKYAKQSNKEADWVFFQSDTNKYKFKSLETMFNDGIGGSYKLIHKEIGYRENENKEDPDTFQKIQKYSFVSQLDGIRNLATGFFGSKTIAHDIINKKIVENDYSYSQYNPADLQNKPFKGSAFNNTEKSSISYMTLHQGMTSASKSFHEQHSTWEGSRRSNIQKLDTNRLIVEVAGGACWWKTIGRMIKVELPTQEGSNPTDKYYTGQYVVLAIKHAILGNNYTITMELGKKRLNQQLS